MTKPSHYSWLQSPCTSLPGALLQLGSDVYFAGESLERSSATTRSMSCEYVCCLEVLRQLPGAGWQQWQNQEAPDQSCPARNADCQLKDRPNFVTEKGEPVEHKRHEFPAELTHPNHGLLEKRQCHLPTPTALLLPVPAVL